MPLLKRRTFNLEPPPEDMKPNELVHQVRFTKEIFRDYEDYIKRINFYRKRDWTCKLTGKTNFTYEEALISEQKAAEKIQNFPEELMAPVLHMVQYNTLNLRDLVNTISAKLQENCLEGIELYAKIERFFGLCKVLKVLESKGDKRSYKVGWLDKCKNVTSTSIISAKDLIRTQLPFSQNMLKSFIRESTCQSAPWVVCNKLAQKYKVTTEPPKELLDEYFKCNELSSRSTLDTSAIVWKKKRKRAETETETQNGSKKRMPNFDSAASRTQKHIKYPIDDLLVRPDKGDPVFSDRPPATNVISVPMECVGDLLMVWDFCISFGKFLHLWPFSLEDFESAICHKNSNSNIIVETHAAIFQVLFKEGEYLGTALYKRRKFKVTAVNWWEFLSYFLETAKLPELSSYLGIVRRGHYGILDARAKLGILRELVMRTLATQVMRQHLDECTTQSHTVSSLKTDKAQEEAKMKTEVKQLANQTCNISKETSRSHHLENGCNGSYSLKPCATKENGIQSNGTLKVYVSRRKLVHGDRKISQEGSTLKKMDAKVVPETILDSTLANQSRLHSGKRKMKVKKQENKTEDKKEALKQMMEKRSIRSDPLGKDRNYNRYWFYGYDGRIFIESRDSMTWGYYSTKKELDLLMGSLNPKGERERALHKQLEKHYAAICKAFEKRSRNTTTAVESEHRRSERVRIAPKGIQVASFLRYVNKWKRDSTLD